MKPRPIAAASMLTELGKSPGLLADILERLEAHVKKRETERVGSAPEATSGSESRSDDTDVADDSHEEEAPKLLPYFSSHPLTKERLEMLRRWGTAVH